VRRGGSQAPGSCAVKAAYALSAASTHCSTRVQGLDESVASGYCWLGRRAKLGKTALVPAAAVGVRPVLGILQAARVGVVSGGDVWYFIHPRAQKVVKYNSLSESSLGEDTVKNVACSIASRMWWVGGSRR
jgi:hypothetical protein